MSKKVDQGFFPFLQFNWYTKRALASKLYVATELYMLQDDSENKEATWEFLDR